MIDLNMTHKTSAKINNDCNGTNADHAYDSSTHSNDHLITIRVDKLYC